VVGAGFDGLSVGLSDGPGVGSACPGSSAVQPVSARPRRTAAAGQVRVRTQTPMFWWGWALLARKLL
jgi:hypothetical protein